MKKSKKVSIYSITAILAVILISFAVKWAIDRPYRLKIPSLPETGNLSEILREQITGYTDQAKLNPTADNLGKLGMAYHSSTYYDKAAQCYELAIKRNDSKWIWSYYNGYLKRELGESEASIKNFRTVIKENKKIILAWYYIGEGYKNQNSNAKAEAAFKNVVNLDAGSGSAKITFHSDYFALKTFALFQLAQIYINNNQPELAEKTLKEIILNNISFGPAYRLLGNIYGSRADSSLSQYYVTRAGDLANFSPPVDTLVDKLSLSSRSELYLLKQIDEAEKGMYPEFAMQLTNNALKYIPDNKYLVSKAVRLYLRMDTGQAAIPLIDRHIGYYSNDFNELKETGNLFFEKGYTDQSVQYFEQALKIKPDDSEIQSNLVLGFLNKGNKVQALKLLDTFLGNYPDNPEIVANAVYFMLMVRDHDRASAYLKLLKRLSPAGSKMYLLSGIMAEQEGDVQKAINLYESSFNSNPRDLVSIQSLAETLMKHQMWSKYIRHLKKALLFNPNEPYILEKLGTILVICPDLKLRDYNQGKIYSERAFVHKACPSELMISAGMTLAEAYESLGDKKKAYSYMNIVSTMARNQKAPPEYLEFISKKLEEYRR